ncbi:MAG TPA: ribonuclease J, partial [Pseudolabrys sp.]|nr:ribonuclease J [Pseudolabrys sp.]
MPGVPQELVFAPLGGVGEIGMNLSIYGIGDERGRAWLAVDLGVSFAAEEHLPGVDLILPDVRYLMEERKNLAGIVLTHAHEDHFGALLDLWPRLRVPVYATPFTAALLEAKCAGEPGAPEIPVKTLPVGGRFTVGPFDIEFVTMAHSIPESNALIIRTPAGTVLHTGDWKIDPTPLLGDPTDEKKLRALGEEGCLALVGDSTNAVREGRSPSEADVAKTIAELVRTAPGRVAVTTFASNVARLRGAADAAKASNREVVVIGRAMERIVQIARETGYLEGVQDFRPVDAYGYLPPNKVVALCTGSQGESRAALSRIAEDQHPEVTFSRGDRVIYSARTIPGNEKAVGRVINLLIEQGIEVITDRTHLVHVSGHPRRAELEEMIGWVKPKILIPVHGEALHMHEHAALARRCGVRDIVQCRNGDLVQLAPQIRIIDEVPAGRIYKDGMLLIEAEARTVADRRRLGFAGAVSVALALTDKGEILDDPSLDLIGIPERDRD